MSSDFFKNRLSPLLGELGYEVKEILPNNSVNAFLQVGSIRIPFLIKFSDSGVDVTDDEIKLFFAELNIASAADKALKGLFIASHFYNQRAYECASELGISLTTYEELLGSTVNFDEYLEEIIHEYENSDLYQTYVGQKVRTLNADYLPAQTELEHWLDLADKNILFLLAESGTGKTSFAKTFAYSLATSFTKEPTGIPIPIYIELKNYKNTSTLSNLVIYHLFNVHNLQLRSFNAFVHLLKEGRLILILDGFDELVSDAEGYEASLFLQELFVLSGGKSKVILTSRPSYFLYNPDEATKAKFDVSKTFERFMNKENYTLLTLRPFKYDQITAFVKKKTGIENKSLLKNIQTDKKLRELAKYPVLLELLLETGIKKVSGKSELFEIYVGNWLKDNNWMVHLTPEGKSILARELAWLLWSGDRERVHYTELPETLAHYVRKEFKEKRDNDYLLTDIQATPFMLNLGGMCSFIHEYFLEYFVSKYISQMMEEEDNSFTFGRHITKTLAGFLCENAGTEKVFQYFSDLLRTSKNRKVRAYSVVTLYNLGTYIKENKSDIDKETYQKIITGIDFRGYDLTGVNLTYARLSEIDFNSTSLSYSVLQNASLFGANLENVDFSKANLEKADLRYANVKHSNLINADMSFALFQDADLSGTICVDAKMVEVNLMNSDCSNAKFNQSKLHAALGVNSVMKNVNFNKADLQNADFSGSDFTASVFSETNLNHTLLEDSVMKSVSMNNSYVWGAEMMKCDFSSATLSSLDMRNVKLAHSKFNNAIISDTIFSFADLRECDFKKTKFNRVDFSDADLRGAEFSDCTFDKESEASLKKAFGYGKQKAPESKPKQTKTKSKKESGKKKSSETTKKISNENKEEKIETEAEKEK